MKIQLNTKELTKIFKVLEKIYKLQNKYTDEQTTQLKNVLIVAEENSIKFYTNNNKDIFEDNRTVTRFYYSLDTSSEIKVLETGKVVLPIIKVYNLLKEFPKSIITLETKQNENEEFAIFTCSQGEFKILANSITLIQECSQYNSCTNMVEVPQKELKKAIEKTFFASTKIPTRLGSFYCTEIDFYENNTVEFSCSDGKRLAAQKIDCCKSSINKNDRIFLDNNFIDIIHTILKVSDSEHVTLQYNDKKTIVLFLTDCLTFSIAVPQKLELGNDFNYLYIIPKMLSEEDKKITCSRSMLYLYLKSLRSVIEEKPKVVCFLIEQTKMGICYDIELYRNEDIKKIKNNIKVNYELSIQCDSTEKTLIAFNIDYILEALKKMENETITILFKDKIKDEDKISVDDNSSPFLITEKNYRYLCMPYRIYK